MSDDKTQGEISRRHFLNITASTLAAGLTASCTTASEPVVAPATPGQKAEKRAGDSPLAIVRCRSYEEDIFSLLKPFLNDLNLPELKGKTVMLKPNMVDVIPGRPATTAVAVIEATVRLADYLGAREIVIGEGPAHTRDTGYLLEGTGHGALYKKLGLRFVDLNLDDIRKVKNENGFSKLDHYWLPKTAVEADCIISVPKLKAHHWARLTCSMKNMFGVAPGRRYGWPKNVLHYQGIDNCTLDLTRLLKPGIQLVDAVDAMEGDGPLNGTLKKADFIMLGADPAAVDATCARIMGIEPRNVPYLVAAGDTIGNIEPEKIKIFGLPLEQAMTPFKPAPPFDPTGRRLKTEDANAASS